jgi:replication-associated recombination protein RarA
MFGFNNDNKPKFETRPTIISHDHIFSFSRDKTKNVFKVKIIGNDEFEKSQYTFRNIKFYEDIKFLLYRAISGQEKASILLIGPKGTAKTDLLEIVFESCHDVIYVNSKTTTAGLAEQFREKPKARILLIDEADKILDKGEKDDIRGFLSTGRLKRLLKSGPVEIEVKNLITIMTANNAEKFDSPFLSRFTRIYLEEYTTDQFKEICTFKMPEYDPNMISELADALIENKMKDVRNMVRLRSFIRPTDPPHVVEMIFKTVLKYETTATKHVNWDKR